MIFNDRIKLFFFYLGVITLGFYFLILGNIYLSGAYLPDERNFLSMAKDSFPVPNNALAYGALYWWVQGAVSKLFSDPLWIMRLISLILHALIPISFLIKVYWEKKFRYLWPFYYWFSFPMSWWMGKITGPEIWANFFAFVGIFGMLESQTQKRILFFSLLFGIGVGIKLNYLPLAVFSLLLFRRDSWKSYIQIVFFMALGFIICSPQIMTSWSGFFQNIPKSQPSYTEVVLINFLKWIFYSNGYQWDGIFNGSFHYQGTKYFYWVVFHLLGFFNKLTRKISLLSIACFVGTFGLMLLSGKYFGWYWFPAIIGFLIFLSFAHAHTQSYSFFIVSIILLLSSFYRMGPIIYREINLKKQHQFNLSDWNNTRICLENYLATKVVASIYDYSEIDHPGLIVGRQIISADQTFSLLWDSRRMNEVFSDSRNVLLLGERLNGLHGFSPNIAQAFYADDQGKVKVRKKCGSILVFHNSIEESR